MDYREKLESLRCDLKQKYQGKFYIIFDDIQLEELLKAKPKTLVELSKIKGFPSKGKKVAAFGQDIINIFNLTTTKSNIGSGNLKKLKEF